MYTIYNYRPALLESWLRCRALAYMRSSFNDEITGEKEAVTAENGVSLVAVSDGQVVGIAEAIFLAADDVSPRCYGLPADTRLTTLDTVAVHPDFQRQGVAQALLRALTDRLKKRGGTLLIYTLDDPAPNKLYQALGAKLCYQASIVSGKSPKNRVRMRHNFFATPNKDLVLFDQNDDEIPYSIEEEKYYVGQVQNIGLLTDVTQVVTENVYLLAL